MVIKTFPNKLKFSVLQKVKKNIQKRKTKQKKKTTNLPRSEQFSRLRSSNAAKLKATYQTYRPHLAH